MDLQQLKSLVDILLAAAASDGHTDIQETTAIRAAIDELGVNDLELRTELEAHQWAFEPANFDLERAVKGLGELTNDERTQVLKLLEQVEEADGVIDWEEEAFIRKVASALGVEGSELDDLTMQIISPPPLPK